MDEQTKPDRKGIHGDFDAFLSDLLANASYAALKEVEPEIPAEHYHKWRNGEPICDDPDTASDLDITYNELYQAHYHPILVELFTAFGVYVQAITRMSPEEILKQSNECMQDMIGIHFEGRPGAMLRQRVKPWNV